MLPPMTPKDIHGCQPCGQSPVVFFLKANPGMIVWNGLRDRDSEGESQSSQLLLRIASNGYALFLAYAVER